MASYLLIYNFFVLSSTAAAASRNEALTVAAFKQNNT
jgi:hypothetical protein